MLFTLETHEDKGAHGMTYDSRGEAYMHAVGQARGRSQARLPRPVQEAHEANTWVVNEALAKDCLEMCGTNFSPSFSGLRRATRAISHIVWSMSARRGGQTRIGFH